MCSILAILAIQTDPEALRQQALGLSRRMRHRGPDWSGIWSCPQAILAHERLAIVGVDSGAQPLVTADGKRALAVNGEIYNHKQLEESLQSDYAFQTESDCEVILPLWESRGSDFLNDLGGMFAFVVVNRDTGEFLIARDPVGIIPLYQGRDEHGNLFVASELKALADFCPTVEEFPPGHFLTEKDSSPQPYYQPTWREYDQVRGQTVSSEALHAALDASVERHLMSDVPYGVLLSGGLDSSLIAALAARHSRRRVEDGGQSEAWWPRLHTFSIGLAESPDLVAARQVAEVIDSVHHEFVFTIQEGLDALSDVIRHVETFDITTIRASTPMYLLARRIKALGVKMVLSGEGADEMFGGYLYFHKAPNAEEFHEETVRKLDQLHKFDCLRANKSMAAWGVEARVPFLDLEFLDLVMGCDAEHKRITDGRMEKHILRQAFEGLLPPNILWRQKEQFSDGVGYSWIDSLKAHAEEQVSDELLARAEYRFGINPPATKEGYLFRVLFTQHFPTDGAALCVPGGKSIACSTPTALAWDAAFAAAADPSGRAVLGVHENDNA